MVGTVDLRDTREAAGDLDGLAGFAQQLVGQPFLFVRPTYGDELTLHFGQLRQPASAKAKRSRGSFVLSLRGSMWQIDPGAGPHLVLSDTPTGTPLDLSALESRPPVTAGSLVVAVRPFADPESGGFGLYLAFSDQSRVLIRPDVSDLIAEADPDLPRLADWELFTPHDRVLRVGPGANWSYTPSK